MAEENASASTHTPVLANCSPEALNELPAIVFTDEQLRNGAIVVPVFVLIYSLYGLAIACDRYFVAAMERICERLNLQEDVAGATFMAFGSSAPEFLTALISVLVESGDIGFGTVIGSAAFNVLLIPGICGLITVGTLSWWPIARDTTFYAIGVITLILMALDLTFSWYESLILVFMYGFYILLMYYNRDISAVVVPAVESCVASKTKASEANSIEDGETTRLTGGDDGISIDDEKKELEEQKEVAYSPFRINDSVLDNCLCVCGFPIHLIMYITTPDCKRDDWASWYVLTFLVSTVWMGFFCYLAVWMVDIIGALAGIPDVVMGLTFLAVGSSLPDLMLSIIVCKQGYLDMAIANAIGSNVFDILICLGVPALIYGVIGVFAGGQVFAVGNVALLYITGMLLASILINALFIGLNGWQLTKFYGVVMCLMYCAYLVASIVLAYKMMLPKGC